MSTEQTQYSKYHCLSLTDLRRQHLQPITLKVQLSQPRQLPHLARQLHEVVLAHHQLEQNAPLSLGEAAYQDKNVRTSYQGSLA